VDRSQPNQHVHRVLGTPVARDSANSPGQRNYRTFSAWANWLSFTEEGTALLDAVPLGVAAPADHAAAAPGSPPHPPPPALLLRAVCRKLTAGDRCTRSAPVQRRGATCGRSGPAHGELTVEGTACLPPRDTIFRYLPVWGEPKRI
jgi:hypothetical protein